MNKRREQKENQAIALTQPGWTNRQDSCFLQIQEDKMPQEAKPALQTKAKNIKGGFAYQIRKALGWRTAWQ